jgi:hypothetical protein
VKLIEDNNKKTREIKIYQRKQTPETIDLSEILVEMSERMNENKIKRENIMFKKLFGSFLFGLILSASVFAQRDLGVRPTDSGGVLMAEQAAYDVKSYDLAVRPNVEEQSIKGVLTVKALIVKPIDKFVLDLDMPFTVESVGLSSTKDDKKDTPLKFERREGKIWIDFGTTKKAGEVVNVRVAYSGKPKVAPRPPWVGGFVVSLQRPSVG